jgi:uncharacterized protein YndB with AHSA1/START domain
LVNDLKKGEATTAMDETEREQVIAREVLFACELVWKAMTEAEHQNRWWGRMDSATKM